MLSHLTNVRGPFASEVLPHRDRVACLDAENDKDDGAGERIDRREDTPATNRVEDGVGIRLGSPVSVTPGIAIENVRKICS